MNPLTYHKFSDDIFMLTVRPDMPKNEMKNHPVISTLFRTLMATRQPHPRDPNKPAARVTRPRSWQGQLRIASTLMRVTAIYASPKFFGIVCDTMDGTHDPAEVAYFCGEINNAAVQLNTQNE